MAAFIGRFPNVEVSYCLFHLSNNAVKNAFSRGLKNAYTGELRLVLRYLPALAFLPPDEVVAGFEDVKQLLLNDPNSPVPPDERARVEGEYNGNNGWILDRCNQRNNGYCLIL